MTLPPEHPCAQSGTSESLRVLLVNNRYRSANPSGEDRVVDQEAAALNHAGHEVERFSRSSDEIAFMSWSAKATLPARVPWNAQAIRELRECVTSFGADVVHVHNVYPLLGAAVLKGCSELAPVVVTFHNYRPLCPTGEMRRAGHDCTECVGRSTWGAIRHGCYRDSRAASVSIAAATVIQRRLWTRLPAAYIFLSDAQRRVFTPLGLPADRCFVKPNLVESSPVPVTPDNTVAYVGRLDEVKGVRILMEAWDRFLERHPETRLGLVIAGAGTLEETVRSWASKHPSVQFLGLLGREEAGAVICRSRAVVVPSAWPEPFGLVVVEAMARSRPAIASSRGAFPELIDDGVTGLLFAPGDASSLAGALARLATTPEFFADLGTAARQAYEAGFTPQRNIAQLAAIYRFAIDNPRDAVPERQPGTQAARVASEPGSTDVRLLEETSKRSEERARPAEALSR